MARLTAGAHEADFKAFPFLGKSKRKPEAVRLFSAQSATAHATKSVKMWVVVKATPFQKVEKRTELVALELKTAPGPPLLLAPAMPLSWGQALRELQVAPLHR